METALWATIGSTLALIFKGVAAGDKSDVESQLEVLRKQLADANTRNGELKNQYGTLTLQARKEALYEEKTKADTQRREIAEAETVWSRATPEVLLQFAKDRQKIANPNPMDDVNPFSGTPPPPPPSTGETAPSTGETAPGGVVAVVATEGDTDESPMADEVVNPPEEDVPAKETANPPPPPPPPAPLKPEDLPTEEGDDPFEPAPSSSTRTSFDQEPKQVLKGGAAVDKSLAAKVPAINDVYANLEQSSMARGYVVRGSLMALYGKLVAAWKSEKGEDPLPPELQQSAFLKGVKEELLAIATGKSSAVADARASAKELKDTVKGIRKWADDTVSESKQVLNEGAPLRNWFDTVPPKKLAKQYPALRGLVVLDASNEDAYVASVNAKTFLNQSKEYVRQWNQLSGLIEQGRDALAAKRSQAVPDDKLLGHLQESIDTLSEAVGAMKALNKVMTTDKETILEEIETNRTILKDTGIRKGDIEKGEAQVQEELDARRKAQQELEEFRRQDVTAAQAPAADVPAADAPAAEVPAATEEPAAIPPPPTSAPPPLTPGSIATAEAKRAAKKASQTTEPEAPPSQTIMHDGILKATPKLIEQATTAMKSLESTKVQLDKGAGLLPKPYLYFDGCRVSTVTLQLRDLCGRLLQILGREVPKLKRTFDSYVSETKKADVPIYNTTLQPKTETRNQTIQDAKRSTQATIQELDTRSAALAADVKRLIDLHPPKGGGTFETIEELYSTITESSTKLKQLLEFVEGLGTTAAQMRQIIDTVIKSPVLSEEKQEAEKTECSKGVAELKTAIAPALDASLATPNAEGTISMITNPLARPRDPKKPAASSSDQKTMKSDAQKVTDVFASEPIRKAFAYGDQPADAMERVRERLSEMIAVPVPRGIVDDSVKRLLDEAVNSGVNVDVLLRAVKKALKGVIPALSKDGEAKTSAESILKAVTAREEQEALKSRATGVGATLNAYTAAPTESLKTKTFAELTAMRQELEPEYRQLYAELYGPPGGPRYAVDSRDPRHMALQAALDPVQARWQAIAAELKTRPETIQAQQEKNRIRLDEARKELEKSIKRQAELDPDSVPSHMLEADSVYKRISSLNREIARLEAALGSAAAPPLGVLEMEAPAGPIPPGDFAGAPVVQPPISATEAASALPGMAPETPGTTLELPSVGDRPPAAAAPADTPGQGVELTPLSMYETRAPTTRRSEPAPKSQRLLRQASQKLGIGSSRKSTFKRRRVGKQNGRRTRRSKNRANRTHSHAR